MKKIMIMVAALTLGSMAPTSTFAATRPSITLKAASEISEETLSLLIELASKNFKLSVAEALEYYSDGTLRIELFEEDDINYYRMTYGGICIIGVIEDAV